MLRPTTRTCPAAQRQRRQSAARHQRVIGEAGGGELRRGSGGVRACVAGMRRRYRPHMRQTRRRTKAQRRRHQRTTWNGCRLLPARCHANGSAARAVGMLHATMSVSPISRRSTPPRNNHAGTRRRTCRNGAASSATWRARHAAAAVGIGRVKRKIGAKTTVMGPNVERHGFAWVRRAAAHHVRLL